MLKDIILEEVKPYTVSYDKNGVENVSIVVSTKNEIKNILAQRNYCEKEDISIINMEELNNEEIFIKNLTVGDLLRLLSSK